MNRPLLFILVVFLFPQLSFGQGDCFTAINGVSPNTYTANFDFTCDFQPVSQNSCNFTTCVGDAWFRWEPGGTNAFQKDMFFTIAPNAAGVFNISLLYSESIDASGNACQWNATQEGYTQYNSLCNVNIAAGGSRLFQNFGLDGGGTYFLLVEKVSGAATQVSVTYNFINDWPAPANDRAAFPEQLVVGSGLDANVNTGVGAPAWINAATVSTRNATKQRMQSLACNPGPATEDHFNRRPFGTCAYNVGHLGDIGSLPFSLNQCDAYLENTTFYFFSVPVSGLYEFILASNQQCLQEPNQLVFMLFNNIDANDARNSNRLFCDKFGVFGGLPNPDATFGPFNLNASQLYYVVIDGTRQSQCRVELLVSRNTLNPVLPVDLLSFEGHNEGDINYLNWVVTNEENFSHYDVEMSLDFEHYQPIGQIPARGTQSGDPEQYFFSQANAPAGKAWYRLNMVDIDGSSTHSKVVEIYRQPKVAGLFEAFPAPFNENLTVRAGVPAEEEAQLTLLDIRGQELMRVGLEAGEDMRTTILETEDLPSGVYLLRLHSRFGTQVLKVTK